MSYESRKKCSSLAPPRSKFYKTQWAWQGVKLSRLISIFTSRNVCKILIKIQLTKSKPKIMRGVCPPCLMPIRVHNSKENNQYFFSAISKELFLRIWFDLLSCPYPFLTLSQKLGINSCYIHNFVSVCYLRFPMKFQRILKNFPKKSEILP